MQVLGIDMPFVITHDKDSRMPSGPRYFVCASGIFWHSVTNVQDAMHFEKRIEAVKTLRLHSKQVEGWRVVSI